eukprot:14068107-Alexandrium_andersonii.AAC.1
MPRATCAAGNPGAAEDRVALAVALATSAAESALEASQLPTAPSLELVWAANHVRELSPGPEAAGIAVGRPVGLAQGKALRARRAGTVGRGRRPA